MRIYSAFDAISPAFERTKLFLYSPFRKGRTWKLSVTGYLSYAGSIFMPFTLLYGAIGFALKSQIGPAFAYGILALSLVLTLLYTFIFILCGRLQFAFFDMVLNRGEFVAPAWRKYKQQSWRWTSMKLIAGTLLVLLTLVPGIEMITHIIRMAPSLRSFGPPVPGEVPPQELMNFMALFYGAYFVFGIIFVVYTIVMTTLSSFMVPSMALENASAKDAFLRFCRFVRNETGEFFLYLLVRCLGGMVGYFGLVFVYEIVLFVLMAVVGCVALLIGFLLHLAGVPMPVVMGIALGLGFLCISVANFYLLGLALGPFFTFFEAHTLYFLGGRYPLLGDLLERSTPPPPQTTAYWPMTPAQPGPMPPA